jgi:hypothetical protein
MLEAMLLSHNRLSVAWPVINDLGPSLSLDGCGSLVEAIETIVETEKEVA